jgi:hypothetical protein
VRVLRVRSAKAAAPAPAITAEEAAAWEARVERALEAYWATRAELGYSHGARELVESALRAGFPDARFPVEVE